MTFSYALKNWRHNHTNQIQEEKETRHITSGQIIIAFVLWSSYHCWMCFRPYILLSLSLTILISQSWSCMLMATIPTATSSTRHTLRTNKQNRSIIKYTAELAFNRRVRSSYSGFSEPEMPAVDDCLVPADSAGFFPLVLGNLSVTIDSPYFWRSFSGKTQWWHQHTIK